MLWRLQWLTEYSQCHQNVINQRCHCVGIPLIILSIALFPFGMLWPALIRLAFSLFVVGWILQFVGHAFERKWPEFFHGWRFLFVGLRWWFTKVLKHNNRRA
ncbi:Mpo1-like protein [Teredinibacter purpureus]|uniref:Mpo1-like protein n=1 Tax=Teredinibacter purpureus TaxID=2731756 RepID=UPI0005F7B284